METILINNQHVYYQVSGSNSCPSSAITMWLICQNLSGQLAGETMGTSLHRDWKANSRGSFMEMRAPWKTASNISCKWPQNCLKPCCNVYVRYREVKCSSRARCTCGALNGKSTRSIRPHGPWSYSQTPDTGSNKVPWEVPDGTECRELTETPYRFSENVLNQPLRAIKAPPWHSQATPPIKNTGLRFSKHLAGFQGNSSTASKRRKAKVVHTQWSDFNGPMCVVGPDYSAAPWGLLLYLGRALLEEPQHPITKIQASIKRDHTLKMKSNNRFSETSASGPTGRSSVLTISRLQTSLDVALEKAQKRTNV